MRAYGDAKLSNILFALGLYRHYRDQGINAAAFDPGNVRTSFGAENNDLLTRLPYRTPLSKLALIAPEGVAPTSRSSSSASPASTGKPVASTPRPRSPLADRRTSRRSTTTS